MRELSEPQIKLKKFERQIKEQAAVFWDCLARPVLHFCFWLWPSPWPFQEVVQFCGGLFLSLFAGSSRREAMMAPS
jgi:hypothetical protein